MKSNLKPLVSILTPAWNRSAYLERVWAGLNWQDYSEIEWIIANDGSTDNTEKVCLELKSKSKFPVIIIESNLRVGKPRMDNELLKAAQGEFIIWCDSDDYLLPGALERLINVWQSMPEEDQANYLALIALCATNEGVLQSRPSSLAEIFDTTWNELENIYHATGDKIFLFKADKIKNSKFVEGDFMVTESSMWLNFFDMKIRYIPEIMKIMDREANGRISFSGKMEYCRGKAYAMAVCEKIKPTQQGINIKYIWNLITYHRYCIHGDIEIIEARNLWVTNVNLFLWFISYTVGILLAIKDSIQGKVVKTHIEYDKNIKIANIRILNFSDFHSRNPEKMF
jgi:glycosyltransferase involved in cell wall biosynthesis